MSAFQAAAVAAAAVAGGGGGYQSGGVGTAFPSAAASTFPHYAIQQGIPYNLYG